MSAASERETVRAYESMIASHVLRGDIDLARVYALDLALVRDGYLSYAESAGAYAARQTIS